MIILVFYYEIDDKNERTEISYCEEKSKLYASVHLLDFIWMFDIISSKKDLHKCV